MNYTIHLTEECNLRCKYCYENWYYHKQKCEISFENIKYIIDREAEKNNGNCFITFYGGEPLLKKNLIDRTIKYAKAKDSKTKFGFSITTNGTLISGEFIDYMKNNNFVNIAYSIDGAESTHNFNRIFENGKGSFDIVRENAKQLLKYFDNVVAMMVITKSNFENLSGNIKYLYDMGFRTFNTLFDYSIEWNDDDLIIIERELKKVADFYCNVMLNGNNINIPIFDEKIHSHINKNFDCNESCLKKMNSVNVGVDGKLYFCMQFVYNQEYVIGDCKNGIDSNLRNRLLSKIGKEDDECLECMIRTRCKHRCPCKNYILTNDVNGLSPIVCEFERMFIRIADKLAENLYNSKCNVFINKFYHSIL